LIELNGDEITTILTTLSQGNNIISIPFYPLNVLYSGEQFLSVSIRSLNASGSIDVNKGYLNVLL